MRESNVHIASRSLLPDRARRVTTLIDAMHAAVHSGPFLSLEGWQLLEQDAKETAATASRIWAELEPLLAPK